MRRTAVALVHYPVLARDGNVVTTAITNLDLHDIARTTYTYGIEDYFVIHPVLAQRQLASRVVTHWTEGSGAQRIPDRSPPMSCLRVRESLQQVQTELGADLWVTSAQPLERAVSHASARTLMRTPSERPVLLVFGTGWGLAPEVTEAAEVQLAPIISPRPDGYNHLSVRAAVAILIDRLLGGPAEVGGL